MMLHGDDEGSDDSLELVTESRTVRLHSTEARLRASVELTLDLFSYCNETKSQSSFSLIGHNNSFQCN